MKAVYLRRIILSAEHGGQIERRHKGKRPRSRATMASADSCPQLMTIGQLFPWRHCVDAQHQRDVPYTFCTHHEKAFMRMGTLRT